MPLEYYYVISPKPYIMVIGMNTRRATTRRAEEGIATVGAIDNKAPPQDNQVPPFENVGMGDQILVVPLPMTDGEIRVTFLNLAQSMTSEANAITSQVQSMTAQVNREFGPRVPHHVNNIAS